MEDYGKRLTLMPKGYKIKYYVTFFLIALLFYVSLILSGQDIIIFSFIILIAFSLFAWIIESEDTIAYENGIKSHLYSKRGFVPYKNIVYICKFQESRIAGLFMIFLEENKYLHISICDDIKTPFDKFIPCMKKHIHNWDDVYHPDRLMTTLIEKDDFVKEYNKQSQV